MDEIRNIVSKMCFDLGLNTAHDYDGVETEEDAILYLKAIHRRIIEHRTSLRYALLAPDPDFEELMEFSEYSSKFDALTTHEKTGEGDVIEFRAITGNPEARYFPAITRE